MVDSKFFGIPFGVSGDKATIPEDTQPSGAVSYQQGFGPDYERNPATDPLAKRVPRDGTNELYYQITNAMRFLQLYGTPEWYATDDGGDPVSYPQGAVVRRTVSGVTTTWVSLQNSNTEQPGSISGPTSKWVATSPSVIQSGFWNYADAGGTANALTATLPLAPVALVNGLLVQIKTSARNTGAATLNLNGLGAAPIVVNASGAALTGGELQGVVTLQYDSGSWRLMTPVSRGFQNVQYFTTSGSFTVPAGVTRVRVTVKGGGGGGSHCQANNVTGEGLSGAGGGEGGLAQKVCTVSPGDIITATVGAAGVGNNGTNTGINGQASSFGAFCSANGGMGASFQVGTSSAGAAGGTATGGDINITGDAGTDGQSGNFVFAGTGGGAQGGRAARQGGVAATGYGCGGGGAHDSSQTNTLYSGGAGSSGLVVVEW